MSSPATATSAPADTAAAAAPPRIPGLDLPLLPASQTDPLQVRPQLLTFVSSNPPSRAWFRPSPTSSASPLRRPLTVLSFLDGDFDDHFFGFFAQFADPLSPRPEQRDAMCFVRAKNVDFTRDESMIQGRTEALVLIGHCSKATNTLTSRPNGGRTFPLHEIMRYVQHFAPSVLVLVACEGGADTSAAPSLIKQLVQATVQTTYAQVIGFACRASLTVGEATFGMTGVFLFRLWAYLAASGRYAWHTRLLVEHILYAHSHAGDSRAQALSDGKGSALLTEYHALYFLAFLCTHTFSSHQTRMLDCFSVRIEGRFTVLGAVLAAADAANYCRAFLCDLVACAADGQPLSLFRGSRAMLESELHKQFNCEVSRDKVVAFLPDHAASTLTILRVMPAIETTAALHAAGAGHTQRAIDISFATLGTEAQQEQPPQHTGAAPVDATPAVAEPSEASTPPHRRSALRVQLPSVLSMLNTPAPYITRDRRNLILAFAEHVHTLLLRTLSSAQREALGLALHVNCLAEKIADLKQSTSQRRHLSKHWRSELQGALETSVAAVDGVDVMFVLPPSPYESQAVRLPGPSTERDAPDAVQQIADAMRHLNVSGMVVTSGAGVQTLAHGSTGAIQELQQQVDSLAPGAHFEVQKLDQPPQLQCVVREGGRLGVKGSFALCLRVQRMIETDGESESMSSRGSDEDDAKSRSAAASSVQPAAAAGESPEHSEFCVAFTAAHNRDDAVLDGVEHAELQSALKNAQPLGQLDVLAVPIPSSCEHYNIHSFTLLRQHQVLSDRSVLLGFETDGEYFHNGHTLLKVGQRVYLHSAVAGLTTVGRFYGIGSVVFEDQRIQRSYKDCIILSSDTGEPVSSPGDSGGVYFIRFEHADEEWVMPLAIHVAGVNWNGAPYSIGVPMWQVMVQLLRLQREEHPNDNLVVLPCEAQCRVSDCSFCDDEPAVEALKFDMKLPMSRAVSGHW